MSAQQIADVDRWLNGADLAAEERAAARERRLARARDAGVLVTVQRA